MCKRVLIIEKGAKLSYDYGINKKSQKKAGSYMIHDNTHLIKALLEGHDAREIIRIEIEDAVNFLLKTELTEFLSYEKHDISGYNTGNSRNGYYERTISTNFGDITVQVPRDHSGGFQNQTLPQYKRPAVGDLETTIVQYLQNTLWCIVMLPLLIYAAILLLEKRYICY